MDHPIAHQSTVITPDFSAHEARERLENRITELAAHIAAATYELLVLIGRYDAEKGWVQHGMASCANWLQWRSGTNPGAAREKVRVARALPGLPQISAAFREGRVSYSKVRAMAREAHALRELSWLVDEDGCWVLKGRFTPEQGAVIRQALEKAMDALFVERQDEHPDVSAETRGGCCRSAKRRACRSRREPCQPTAAAKSTTTTPRGCWSNTIRATAELIHRDGEARSVAINAIHI